ncbi:MAG TPA: hypothetical protein VLJ38_12560, partial [Polyangiaceae bacterium]|nr:hypothetical protein [Polyangiaceae bacterium]
MKARLSYGSFAPARARSRGAGARCSLLLASLAAAAHGARPLPEAVLTESATDIDAVEHGELEWELNLSVLGAREGGARSAATSVELEWRMLDELGLRLEPTLERFSDGLTASTEAGFAGALAFGLFHDFERDTHVQLELLAHTLESAPHAFEMSDAELPGAADLVAATRRGRFTLRATAGAEAFGSFVHAPLHTELALLTGILRDERYGFVALDVRADWARRAPFVIAPEFVADGSPLGIPLRLSAALPFNVGARSTSESFGLLLRLTLTTERERLAQ